MSEETKDQNQTPAPTPQPSSAPMVWSHSAKNAKNIAKSREIVSLKHGMFSSIPIICRGAACPYFQTCWIPQGDLEVGERCPIEIAAIMERFDKYCDELAIIPENDIIDAGLVKEVVDLEVMMLRADGLLAKDGHLIEQVVAGVTPKGQEYYKPELHVAVDLKERLRKEKTRILNQLNATRKDKKGENIIQNDPSSVAARIIAKVRELQSNGTIIDVDPETDAERGEE